MIEQVLVTAITAFVSFIAAVVYRLMKRHDARDREFDDRLAVMERMIAEHRQEEDRLRRMIEQAEPVLARRELYFLADRVVKLERAAPLSVRVDPAEAKDGDIRCPYCHGDLGTDGLVTCARCEARQHVDCFESHGRCAVFGCGSQETREGVRSLPVRSMRNRSA